MLWLFRALTDRLKSMFVADVAQDFEAQLLARDAERKAELLRQAARYEEEGLTGIAEHLRKQAESLNLQRPLATVLPAVEHLAATPLSSPAMPLLPFEANDPVSNGGTHKRTPNPKKKGR